MSEKIAALIEEVKGLSVLELSELVHALEETFGVSAAAAAVAAPAAGAAEAAEEKTEFDVVLKECGANKIAFKGQSAGFLVDHGYTCIRTRKTDLLVSFCHLRSGGSGECRNKKRTGHYGTQQERK